MVPKDLILKRSNNLSGLRSKIPELFFCYLIELSRCNRNGIYRLFYSERQRGLPEATAKMKNSRQKMNIWKEENRR